MLIYKPPVDVLQSEESDGNSECKKRNKIESNVVFEETIDQNQITLNHVVLDDQLGQPLIVNWIGLKLLHVLFNILKPLDEEPHTGDIKEIRTIEAIYNGVCGVRDVDNVKCVPEYVRDRKDFHSIESEKGLDLLLAPLIRLIGFRVEKY